MCEDASNWESSQMQIMCGTINKGFSIYAFVKKKKSLKFEMCVSDSGTPFIKELKHCPDCLIVAICCWENKNILPSFTVEWLWAVVLDLGRRVDSRSWCEQCDQVGSRKIYHAKYTYSYSLIVMCRFKRVFVKPSKHFYYMTVFMNWAAHHFMRFILS